MQVGDLPTENVGPGDVVDVPAGTSQRITNVGDEDLLFLCVCTPRFWPGCYEDLEHSTKSNRQGDGETQATLGARGQPVEYPDRAQSG